MVQQYRKKPVVIEAVQWNGGVVSTIQIESFVGSTLKRYYNNDNPNETTPVSGLIIPTLEGNMLASIGDYIIKGVRGEFYPCKPDIFEKTYTVINNSSEFVEKTPVEQLSEDLKSDPAYWDTWVANIAMCIYDQYTDEIPDPLIGRISHADLLRIANRGADRFLKLLTSKKGEENG